MKLSVTEFVAKIAILSLLILLTVYREAAIFAPREEFLFFVGSAVGWLLVPCIGGIILGLVIWGATTLLIGRTSGNVGRILVLSGLYLSTLFVLWGEGARIASLTGAGFFTALLGSQWMIYVVGLGYALPGIKFQDSVGNASAQTLVIGTNRWKLFGAVFAICFGGVFLLWLFVRGSDLVAMTLVVGLIVAVLLSAGFLVDLLRGRLALWKLPMTAGPQRRPSSSQPDWQSMQQHLVKTKNWDGLKMMAKDWLAAEHSSHLPWFALGLAQINTGENAEAVRSYENALRLSPRDPVSWHNLGLAHENLGGYEQARTAYANALKRDRQYSLARDALYRVERALEAQKADSPERKHEQDWRSICREHARSKNWHALGSAAYQWLERDPQDALAMFSLGLALLHSRDIKDYRDSVWWFKAAIKQAGDNATYWYHLALGLQKLERNDEAIDAAQKALRLKQNFREATELLEQLTHSAHKRNSSARDVPPRATDRHTRLATLELNHDASPEEIKAAYRRLMQQYHPDKVANLGRELRELAERKAKEINEAYEGLLAGQVP